jgi:hypothetical protein
MWVLMSPSRPATSAVPEALEQEIARTEADMKSLRERVAAMEQRIDAMPTPSERSPTAASDRLDLASMPHAANRQPAASDVREPVRLGTAHDTQWVSVLDQAVARCLIEHGLSPFEPGVSRPVLQAGDELRAEETKSTEEYSRLYKLPADSPGYQESLDANLAQHRKARKAIVDRLSAALDDLRK